MKKADAFSETFENIRNSLPEKIKCVVCEKEFETHAKCFKPIHHKGKDGEPFTTGAVAPFLIVGHLTTHLKYPMACKECSNKILRSAGIIPEKFDKEVFPQVRSQSFEPGEAIKALKGEIKFKWKIVYKDKSVPKTEKLYNKMLTEACIEYLKKYPYIGLSVDQLKKLIKNYHSKPLDFG